MSDKPIPFSAPMVRAILDGRKTQTRRVMKPQPYPLEGRPRFWNACGVVGGRICSCDRDLLDLHNKPKRGDRLWVRESYYQRGHWQSIDTQRTRGGRQKWKFVAADDIVLFDPPNEDIRLGRIHKDPTTIAWHKRLGRFMPRRYSRFTLLVTDVRIERLNDISEADAWAEGCKPGELDDYGQPFPAEGSDPSGIGERGWDYARDWFADLWDHINGDGAWDANPWVPAYSFMPMLASIDAEGAS